MVKATDISVSNMCWSICIFGSILWAFSIATIEGHQLRPNIVLVLTDDQDITLNGMVNSREFYFGCDCASIMFLVYASRTDSDGKNAETAGQSGCNICECGECAGRHENKIIFHRFRLELWANVMLLLNAVYVIADVLSLACIYFKRPVRTQPCHDEQYNVGRLLRQHLAPAYWTAHISRSTAK